MTRRTKTTVGCAVVAVAVLAAPLLLACKQPTTFRGSADFEGGPSGCWDKCAEAGMQMGAFVYVGDYSSGCVCEPKRTSGGRRASATTTTAAAAGVVAQARRQAEAQRAAAQRRQQQQQQQQQQQSFSPGYGGY